MRSKKVTEAKEVKFFVRLSVDDVDFLNEYSKILNCTKSEAVRKLIKMYKYKFERSNNNVNKSSTIND